jgi:hypothetical protein
MTERSRPWDGTATGDAGPYSDDQWTDTWKSFHGPTIASQGVFKDNLNELAASGAVSPVSINTGRAMVDGIWYESDTAVTVAMATPAVNPRVDRIVLRKDWAGQTVRITRIAGAEAASPVAPALTQIDGTTWDLPLWQIHITTGGAITRWHDEREMLGQFTPAGFLDAAKVYLSDDFMEGSNWATGDVRRIWSAIIEASGSIDVMAVDADIPVGGIVFGHDGASGTAQGGQLSSGKINITTIDGTLEVRLKSPNSDANLDRYVGFLNNSKDITPPEGIFFRQEGVANWFGVTRTGNVETTVDMGVGATDVIKRLKFKVLGTDSVAFLLDDVLQGVSITNIPSGGDNDLRIGILDDGTLPATAPYMEVDSIVVKGDR